MTLYLNGTTGISGVDGSAGTPAVQGTDTNTGISFPAADTIAFNEGGAEAMRIDSSSRLLIGTSTSNSNTNSRFQIADTSGNVTTTSYSANNSSAGYYYFFKNRGASVDSHTVLQSGDGIANLYFAGSDGTTYRGAASIEAVADGGWSSGDAPGRLVFSTTRDGQSSPSEACRIDNSQRLLVGTTSTVDSSARISVRNTTAGGIAIESDNSGTFGIRIYNATTGASQTSVGFLTTGGASMGAITNNNSTVTYSSASDYRLKENVSTITNAISRLQQLKPSRFNFISTPGATVDGFIAHEVQEVVPEAITGEKDAVDEDGNPIYQGIDQSKLVPLLTAALQEAIGEIESLKARVAALETA